MSAWLLSRLARFGPGESSYSWEFCLGFLFQYRVHVPGIHSHGHEDSLELHWRGMWLGLQARSGSSFSYQTLASRAARTLVPGIFLRKDFNLIPGASKGSFTNLSSK